MILFPVLENEDIQFFSPVLGDVAKHLNTCAETLQETAQQLNLTPLQHFITYSREEALGVMAAEEVEELEAELRDDGWFYQESGERLWSLTPEWFAASVGLKTTRGLYDYLDNTQLNMGMATSIIVLRSKH